MAAAGPKRSASVLNGLLQSGRSTLLRPVGGCELSRSRQILFRYVYLPLAGLWRAVQRQYVRHCRSYLLEVQVETRRPILVW